MGLMKYDVWELFLDDQGAAMAVNLSTKTSLLRLHRNCSRMESAETQPQQAIMDPTLYKIASRVRQRVKQWARNNPDIFDLDLTGGCAIASYALWEVLKARGVKARLVVSEEDWGSHCWVEVNRHVIDLTASQFDGPPIAYFPREAPPKWFANNIGPDRRVNTRAVRSIRQWGGQNPFKYQRPIERLVERLREV